MSAPDLLRALQPVVAEFNRLGVRYYVGGSAASSLYGKARHTLDVDVVASVEDVIVKKLEWYRLGNEVSQQQWEDVTKIIELQGKRLDVNYMRQWASDLQVLDLLEKAISTASSSD